MSENKSFTIKKTYVKDLSVEVPNGPEAFLSKSPPKIDFKVDRNNLKINQDDYIVSLTSEVNAKNDEITFFVIEATFSGIFEIKNYDEKEVKQILEYHAQIYCFLILDLYYVMHPSMLDFCQS